MEDHISDVEEVSVVEFDPEVAIAEIYAVKVWEQMMAERFAEEAKDVAVVVAMEDEEKAVGVREDMMASRFEYEEVAGGKL